MKRLLAAMLGATVLLGGCAASGLLQSPVATPTNEPSPLTQPTLTAQPTPSVTPTSNTPREAQELIAKAQSDLAQRLNTSVAQIQFVSFQSVDWPNLTLGCPQQKMSYAQVSIPGYLIVLEVNGNQYEYHGRLGGDPFLCSKGFSD